MWNEPRARLWRDPDHGVLAGVCAGLANYLGVERVAIRLAFVLGLIFFFVPAVLAYVVLSFVLPRRPPALFSSGEEEAFWRGLNTRPDDAVRGLTRRFGDLEARLRAMEGAVASPDFDLRRRFRDL
ncbi:MAG TPA: envelope stress response membrane protein PspC [Stellaceae bacterium]|nr:envelope stress response membrane protein PspC [Stellaceae bacterium]